MSTSNLLTGADEEVDVSRVEDLSNLIRPLNKKISQCIFADKLTTDKKTVIYAESIPEVSTFKSPESAI